jgi:hypothetical protein
MARSLQFRFGEAVLAFEVGAKVDKKALYGYAKRIAEKARRPRLIRQCNLNELHPVKLGKRMPAADSCPPSPSSSRCRWRMSMA